MDNLNLNQPPQPQIQNTNVNTDVPQPRDPKADLSGVNVLSGNPANDRSGILVLQNDIRNSAKGDTSLTTDLFSSLGSAPQKQSFESYTPYKSSDLYATLGSGERVARYENYIPGTDNNERLAAQQSTGDKWINGASKALAKTGSAVVGGTVGLVYGVGAALNDGSFTSIYDNSFSNTLADWDSKLSYQLPNLYTKQEQEKGLFGQMGTANFWSDKFLGGLSFTAGAIISEGIWAYATGGASLSTLGARMATKAGALGRAGRWGVEALGEAGALQGLSKYKSFYKEMMANSLQAGRISKTTANALGKAGEIASSVGVLARSAGYEASVEALQYRREAEENFHNSFLSQHGREPSMEEVQKFDENLKSSSNAVFGYNMGILMPSNLVSMGHILDIKSPINTGFTSFIDKKLFGYGVGKTVDAAGKSTFKALEATAGQKIARTAYNYAIKPSLSEGLFEEGLQGVTTKTANKWLEHTYDPKHSNTNLDSMGAFYESLGEQYGTKEGWVENGLGMIIGIVGGSVNARSEMAQKAGELEYESAVATEFQTGNLQGLLMPNRLQSANRMAGFSEEAKIEAQKGNISKSALAQKSALLTFINAKMTLGDSVSDIVKEAKLGLDSTTDEQWKEAGIPLEDVDTHKEETIKEFEDLAKDWKSNKTYWGYMIGQKLVGEQELDTTIAGETTKGGANTMIEALAWQSTIGESANKHMKDAQSAIASELGTEHANAINLNSNLRVQKRELRQQINVDTRSYKTELARRDALVSRIAKLNAMPKAPEGANKPAGKQAGVLTQSLIESEEKLAALTTQLDGYAEQINKSSAYQKEVGAVDFSSQDLSKDVITGQDLVSLDDNLKKFETVLETLKGTNPQRATYLNDLLKEYSDSEKIFLEHKATQRAILDSDFKIENINSWIQGKVKKNAPMNENTKEWFTQTLESYKKGKEDSMAIQAEAKLAEGKEARKQEIVGQLAAIEDPESEEAKALQDELDSLEKPEEVELPIDKSEVVAKTREQEIRDEIATLEEKRQAELGSIEDRVASVKSKLGHAGNQQLFDNFLSLLKQGRDNLTQENIDALLKGLSDNSVAVIGGTTDTKRNTTERGDLDTAWVDNPSSLSGVDLQEFEMALSKLFLWIQSENNTRQQPEVADETGAGGINTKPTSEPVFIGDIVRDILSNQQSQSEQAKAKVNEKYDKRIEALQNELNGKAPSQVEVYKKRISEALKGNHNYLSYMGDNYDDVANKKPTSAEVEEFKKLRDDKKFNDPRYKELEQKLSDWKLLDSAVDQQYVSIGDLILGIEQLEQEAAKEDTVDEITPEHAPDIADDEGVKATENVTRYDILQNTNGSMTVKRRKDGKLTLHHLKLSTIATKMNTEDFTLKNKEGEQILFGEEERGTVLTIEGVEFKVGVGNAIEVNEDDFMKLQERLNMFPLNTGTTNWTYSDIYTKVGDDFVKMESDFKDATINSERIYELQEGDKLSITINNDGYNDQLLEEYESAKGDKAKKAALKKLKENLKLNATTTNGVTDNVSILKALRDEVDEHFIRLREKAFELYMAATDKTNVKLGIEVTVGGIFLGSPRFTINEDGKIQSNPITERGAKEIVATGYIENGNVVTSREIKDINKTFVGKLSKNNKDKKIPIVVVRRGNYNVAYPVSMTKTGSNLSSTFDSIFEMKISNQEKVRRINEAIQNNGIKTAKLVYDDVYNEQKLDSTRKAFEEKTTFVSAEDFADKNYKIDNVVRDANINIDLEDLGNIIADAKLRIKLDDSIKYMTEKELKYASMTDIENQISDIGIELYNDYVKNAQTKYVKANGKIIEDTGYTDTLDETPIKAPTSQLDKVKNINTLRKAFEGLTPALNKIIGREKIATVKAALKQYDFIKAQVTPKNTNVKNGAKNSKC